MRLTSGVTLIRESTMSELGYVVLILVQVWGNFMTIRYLDPWGLPNDARFQWLSCHGTAPRSMFLQQVASKFRGFES